MLRYLLKRKKEPDLYCAHSTCATKDNPIKDIQVGYCPSTRRVFHAGTCRELSQECGLPHRKMKRSEAITLLKRLGEL
tara:strand:- start:301 stop:534 length:234 start_codon:yes stop_codon:yes gene_type:complete